MVYQAVIDSISLVLKRAGFCDFENDGTFDPLTETILNIPPIENPIIPGDPTNEGSPELEVMIWDGRRFRTVTRGLRDIKADKIEVFKAETSERIGKHYSAPLTRSLVLLLGDTASRRVINAMAQATSQGALNWVNEALDHHYAKIDEIEAAGTLAEVEAVALDFDELLLADPLVTISGTRDILDLENRGTGGTGPRPRHRMRLKKHKKRHSTKKHHGSNIRKRKDDNDDD